MGTTLRMVLISPMMGLSMGGMAVIARYIGQRDQRMADRAVMQVILLIALLTIPIMIIGQTLTPAILCVMGASPQVEESATAFLRIIWWGLFFMECLPTMSGVIKGAGRPEYTLRINLVNLVLVAVLSRCWYWGWAHFRPWVSGGGPCICDEVRLLVFWVFSACCLPVEQGCGST